MSARNEMSCVVIQDEQDLAGLNFDQRNSLRHRLNMNEVNC